MVPPIMPTGEEPEEVDVGKFYVRSEELAPCASPVGEADGLIARLSDAASWTVTCAALLSARRLAVHHPVGGGVGVG